MKRTMLIFVAGLLMLSSLACTISLPALPDIDVPRLEVGEMQEYEEKVTADGVTEAEVQVRLGAGEISLVAGDTDNVFSGSFRTNVVEWAPEVVWEDGTLEIDQGESEGMPEPGAENEWDLAFSPEVALDFDIDIGASDGDLDFTGLAVTRLSLEVGASDMVVRFDEPNQAQMDEMIVRVGATSLRINGIGNAGPEEVDIQGGVGNLILDFTGEWPQSTQASITAGTGSITLRLPRDVGVHVSVEGGLGNVDADNDLSLSDGAYVNDAFGETGVDIVIEVTVGLGNLELELVSE